MKSIVSLVLIVAALAVSSCCKNKSAFQVSEIRVMYYAFDTSQFVYDIRTNKDNIDDIKDTVILQAIYIDPNDSIRDFKIQLFLAEGKFNHILMAPDSSRFDTISKIEIFRDQCNKIETQEIYWNGNYTTETYFEITK